MPISNSCLVCGDQQNALFEREGYTYCRCRSCGLVSSAPIPDEQSITAHYAAKFSSGNHELARRYSDSYQRMLEPLVPLLRESVDFSKHPTVLDIGCFTGDLLTVLQKAGADVYGVELQPEAVAIATQKFPGRIFQTDVYSKDFPDLKFDVVTMTGVIEHVTDPLAMLARCRTLLKPNGLLLLETPNSGSRVARVLGSFWPPYAPVEHIHLFSEKSLRAALNMSGFKHVRVRRHWKVLPVEYVYQNLANFGPAIRRLAAPLYRWIPGFVKRSALPFYVGEVIVTARANAQVLS